MNSETTLSHYDSYLDSTNLAIEDANAAFQNYGSLMTTVNSSIENITATIIQVKEIEASIKVLDLQVELMCKEYDVRIEKCKTSASMVQNAIDRFSNMSDAILNEILAMDSSSDDQNYIRHRSELISLLRSTSDSISSMVILFLSI